MNLKLIIGSLSLLLSQLSLAGETQHLPQGPCSEIVDHTYFSLCYESHHRQASWVKYTLNSDFINGKQKRTNNYRIDPQIEDPVMDTDYKGSGYDRGHLLPAADMKLSYQSMSETFYMSNMSPQKPNFNRKIWAYIEREVRDMVLLFGEAHVVTAGILEPNLPQISTGVSVPNYYFKVLYFPEAQLAKAFLIEHRSHEGAHPSDFLTTVDEVEARSGFDFFAELPDELEDAIEAQL